VVLEGTQQCSQESVQCAGLGQVLQHDNAAEPGDELYTGKKLHAKLWVGVAGLLSAG
jgi:hypothetical protein